MQKPERSLAGGTIGRMRAGEPRFIFGYADSRWHQVGCHDGDLKDSLVVIVLCGD